MGRIYHACYCIILDKWFALSEPTGPYWKKVLSNLLQCGRSLIL